MQTFLPYPSFYQSASCLDYRRLGKQRVEAKQLLNIFQKLRENPNAKVAWMNHPAFKMWVGYENALKVYHNIMIMEWKMRGYRNTMPYLDTQVITYPPWYGDEKFHASHRSNLLRKDPVWYGRFGWSEPPTLEYYWPV